MRNKNAQQTQTNAMRKLKFSESLQNKILAERVQIDCDENNL